MNKNINIYSNLNIKSLMINNLLINSNNNNSIISIKNKDSKNILKIKIIKLYVGI